MLASLIGPALRLRGTSVTSGLIVLLWSSVALAVGVDFDYQVESFRVEGNLPGDLTDEFDDGSLGAWFVTPGGTVSEFDGALHLMGPGFQDTDSYSILNPDIILNRSDAFAPPAFTVSDNAGDFNATSTWRNLPEAPGGFYSMGLRYSTSASSVKGVSLSISNLDQESADAFGSQAGLIMSLGVFTFDVPSQALLSIDSERFAIDPSDVIGDIVLQLFFDDLGNEIFASVSLDGGSSFLNPFAGRSANLGDAVFGGVNFFLFGDPVIVPEPSTGLLVVMGLVALGGRRRLGRLQGLRSPRPF